RCLTCAKGFAGSPHDTPGFLAPPQRSAPVCRFITPGPHSPGDRCAVHRLFAPGPTATDPRPPTDPRRRAPLRLRPAGGLPRLQTIQDFRDTVPDQQLLQGLRVAPRDDFPIERQWRVVLLTIALRHAHCNGTLAELHRNPSLCRLLDIRAAGQVPHDWNLSP